MRIKTQAETKIIAAAKSASALFLKHRDQTKDHSDLVDWIVHDQHGDTPTIFEQLRQDSDHGVQQTKGNF